MTKIVNAQEAASLLNISASNMGRLLNTGRIIGAQKIGEGRRCAWLIPLGDSGLPDIKPARSGPTPSRRKS